MQAKTQAKLAVVVADGMADTLPERKTFIQSSTALGLALQLSALLEDFRREEQGKVTEGKITLRTFLQHERLGTCAGLNFVLVASRRADRHLHVIGLTSEEADFWRD